MPTYIKTGFWEKKPRGYKEELDLNLLIAQNAPASSIATNGTSLYSTNPLAGPLVGELGNIGNIILGEQAGENSEIFNSNFLGPQAGRNATYARNSNFLGYSAGINATNANNSNFLGNGAGQFAINASYSNFFGNNAGAEANAAYQSNFLGSYAGTLATTANNSNFFGYEAGMNSTGNNVNAFGYQANKGGTLSGQTVFSNASLPSYTNRSAATTAITVPNGAVAGNTYLYYNQTTFAIEAVRL